jgi:hypothetical protein
VKHFVAVKHIRKYMVPARFSGPSYERVEEWCNASIETVNEDDKTFDMPSVNAAYPLRGKLYPGRLQVIAPDTSKWSVPMLRDGDGVLRSVWPVMDYEYVICENVGDS